MDPHSAEYLNPYGIMTYEQTLEVIRAASREFRKAQKAYRAKEIGDEEFLAASKTYKEAEELFDKAFWEAAQS